MDSIGQLFDKFAVAYQHSLYAIEQEKNKANKKREEQREIIRKQFAREKSKSATSSVNNLMATLHKLNEVSREINREENTVIKVAEYFSYGKLCVENIKKMSGKVNYAITGVTIKDLYQNKEISFTDVTEVYFKNVSDKDIAWYVENEKYLLNRAGYSIAGKTSIFVDKIVGDYYNILGMPISKLYSKLNELGYSISDFEMKS